MERRNIIDMKKAQSRLGEKRMMNCGMNATIIAYRNAQDLDVQFDDGAILTGYRYEQFQKGKIPHQKREKPDISLRIGETRSMNCGMNATIIKYNASHDIDVKFEDGLVLKKKYYGDFVRGLIKHPHPPKKKDATLVKVGDPNTHIGEVRTMKCGLNATVIAYSKNCVDVMFDDGCIEFHRQYSCFKRGEVVHPDFRRSNLGKTRVGQTNTMNCGINAQIIAYRKNDDIDVKFEDGVIQRGYRYEQFQKGRIPHPNYKYSTSISRNEFAIMYYLKDLGFRKIEQGEFADLGFGRYELDFYNEKLKVAIEYDGNIHKKDGNHERDLAKNKLCKKNGIIIYRIREKGLEEIKDGISHNFILSHSNLEILTQELADIIKSILDKHNIPSENINFEKDRETILKLYHAKYHNKHERERIGISKTMNCGKVATIIAYRGSCDIDVQFEDGYVSTNKAYSAFLKGCIIHPLQSKKQKALDRTGTTALMNCGLKATIIAYRKYTDIDIQFENGIILKNQDYKYFLRKTLKCPSESFNEAA